MEVTALDLALLRIHSPLRPDLTRRLVVLQLELRHRRTLSQAAEPTWFQPPSLRNPSH